MMAPMTDPAGIRIRIARPEEIPRLPEIERSASARFEAIAALAGVPPDPTPVAALEDSLRQDLVWVAVAPGDEIVGFAYACVIDRCLHLEEIDVLPAHGRRGLGGALVQTVCERARALGLDAVTLTTFRDVPWNAPFYARMGFRVIDRTALSPGQAEAMRDEGRRGLPLRLRVFMRCDLIE
jgi:GNAT superfamily N-acetyltransferase